MTLLRKLAGETAIYGFSYILSRILHYVLFTIYLTRVFDTTKDQYGIYRDLWEWTLDQMRNDPKCLQKILGFQFDHGGSDLVRRRKSIDNAVDWVLKCVESAP